MSVCMICDMCVYRWLLSKHCCHLCEWGDGLPTWPLPFLFVVGCVFFGGFFVWLLSGVGRLFFMALPG